MSVSLPGRANYRLPALLLALSAVATSQWTVAKAEQQKPATPAAAQAPADPFPGLKFRNIGPATMGGRVDDLAVLESNPAVFYVGSVLIDRMSGGAAPAEAARPADAPPRSPSRRDPRTDGLAIVLGAILDGIPESIVLGASLIAGTGVGIPVLVAIAVSNVPEALSASKDLANAGIARSRILGLWFGVAVVSALAAGIGFGVLSGAPQGAVAFIQAFAAGAILAMLSESMIPEAQEIGGRAVGLATSFGFAVAASLSFVA